jgi:signal transduction histidine kinase
MRVRYWSWPRRRLLALTINLVLVAASLLAAVVSSSSDDWHPIGLLATLSVFAVISELLSSEMRDQVSANGSGAPPHFTSGATAALAVVFLGPAPALVVALTGLAAATVAERTPPRDFVANLANYSFHVVTAALLAELALAGREASTDGAAAAVAVMCALLYIELCSNVLLALYEVIASGRSPRALAAAVWRLLLTVEPPLVLLCGFTAYVYVATGLLSVAVLIGVQVLFVALARALHRSYDQVGALATQAEQIAELSASRSQLVGQILSAEERERRRLSEALHDHAMQNLLAGRQDLSPDAGAREIERARRAMDATIDQLRDAIFELHPAVLERVGLAAAIEAVADRAARRGGFDVTVSVTPDTSGVADLLLFTVSRELLANAATHARAAHVRVEVVDEGTSVAVEVADDGCGFATTRLSEAVRQGHIGLASIQERIEALGGSFELDSRPGGGTAVRACIPRRVAQQTLTTEPVA